MNYEIFEIDPLTPSEEEMERWYELEAEFDIYYSVDDAT
jgi:hypothetical protein